MTAPDGHELTVPPPGRHGGDGAALARHLGVEPSAVLDLSASLNPAAPDVVPSVVRAAQAVRTYPDDRAARLSLAEAMAVDPDRLVLTNGGAEAIALVAAQHPVGWVDEPDFSLYRRHLGRLDPAGLRWRSNPHNPSGRLATASERAGVWDEAFYPLATGSWTRGDPAAVVVGSLTKLFACPGLRIGYVLAPTPEFAAAVAARRPEWSVNGLACAVLPELLASADLPAWVAAIAALRAQLVDLLRSHGFDPAPSAVNYVLVPQAPGLRDRLARHAVLVRDTASFGIPDGVRIAVPRQTELDRLATALAS